MKPPAMIRDLLSVFRAETSLDRRGEQAAAKYLKRLRYKIVARNYSIRSGELDIVAVDGRTVVFVEVKSRASVDKGHPAEAVDEDKQQRLTRVALAYLKRFDLLECSARFDVVAVLWPRDQKTPAIEHFKNAFEAVGQGQMFR